MTDGTADTNATNATNSRVDDGETDPDPSGPLWRERDLLRFAAARVLAVAGSAVTAVATSLLVWQLSGSELLTSLVAAAQVAPYLVLGLLAGAMADRLPRRRVMVASQVICAAGLLTVPLADAMGVLTVGHVLAVALLLATCFVWFDAAAFGALPAIMGRDRVVAANSLIWTSTTLVGIGAPALAGLLVGVLGPAQALSVDAVAYLAAAGLMLRVVASMDPPADTASAPGTPVSGSAPTTGTTASDADPATTIRQDIAEGLRFVLRHPLVRDLTLLGIGNSLAGGAVTALLVVLAAQDAGGPAAGESYGLMLTVVALGGFLAAALLPRLAARVPTRRLTVAGLVLGVPPVALLAAEPPYPVVLGVLLVWSGSNTLVVLNGITARQQVTPHHLQARVNTTARLIAWGGAPLGAIAGGTISEVWSTATALAAAAAVLGVTTLVGLASRH